ncbi:hypothetical protein [Glutamicibacter arilaitensis]|uniref:hypothetical protein n=1 Tax=Glutamicibacter arilaitensis TaxID=256701 RepID=UPI003A93D913
MPGPEQARLPSLASAVTGQLTTGAIKCLIAIVLAWICSWWIALDTDFGRITLCLVISYIVSEIVGAIIARPIVLKEGRSNPGGVPFVVLPFTAGLVISFVASYALTGSMHDSLLAVILIAVCNAAEIFWLKPWEKGPTSEEEHATFSEFKAMTKEHFADDVEQIKSRARDKTREKYFRKKARREAKAKQRNYQGDEHS